MKNFQQRIFSKIDAGDGEKHEATRYGGDTRAEAVVRREEYGAGDTAESVVGIEEYGAARYDADTAELVVERDEYEAARYGGGLAVGGREEYKALS